MNSTHLKLPVALVLVLALGACGVFKKGSNKTPVLGQRVPILLAEKEVTADERIAGVQVVLPVAEANDAWAQPGGNPSKSMGHPALAETVSRAWSVQIAGGNQRQRLAAAPVVAGGRVYVMDVDSTVHAFAADTGAKVWNITIDTDKENRNARFGGGVSFDDSKLYATDGLGQVVALNADDGKELWRVKPAGPLRGAPVVSNGNVYVLTQDNQIFALAQADGSLVWRQAGSPETQGVFGVAPPAASAGTVVAGFSSGELNAYRYENGRTLWQDALSRSAISTSVSALSDIDAAPVIDQGRVYAVGQGGRTVAIDIGTGQRVWAQNFAGISTPWVAGEWLFMVTTDGRLVCLTRSLGTVRWITQLQAYRSEKKKKGPISWFGPVLAGGRLILVNSRGAMVEASVETGAVTRTNEKAGDAFNLSPVIAGNTLYTLDVKGRLTAWR